MNVDVDLVLLVSTAQATSCGCRPFDGSTRASNTAASRAPAEECRCRGLRAGPTHGRCSAATWRTWCYSAVRSPPGAPPRLSLWRSWRRRSRRQPTVLSSETLSANWSADLQRHLSQTRLLNNTNANSTVIFIAPLQSDRWCIRKVSQHVYHSRWHTEIKMF